MYLSLNLIQEIQAEYFCPAFLYTFLTIHANKFIYYSYRTPVCVCISSTYFRSGTTRFSCPTKLLFRSISYASVEKTEQFSLKQCEIFCVNFPVGIDIANFQIDFDRGNVKNPHRIIDKHVVSETFLLVE